MKRIFKWFFCNLFYYYANKSDWLDKSFGAKKEKRPSDRIIIRNIAMLMMFPVGFVIYYIAHIFNIYPKTHAGIKLFGLSIAAISLLIFRTMFDRLFYRNKRYLKLMEGFAKKDYNKYIVIITIFFFIVLPIVIIYFLMHKELLFGG